MDDEGSLHVVEALLAGMIILTAVLFLTNVSKPSPPAAESGIDLEGVARDLLVVLENRPPTDNACTESPKPDPCYPSMLDEVVGHALGFGVATDGERDVSNSGAEDFLRQVVPVGNRWLLRLDNGVEPLVLLPTTGSNVQLTPRAAKAAETFVVPPWQALSGAADCNSADNLATATIHMPGQDGWGAVAAASPLESPTGDLPPAPYAANAWSAWWRDHVERDTGNPDSDVIPTRAPYGWWRHDGTCHFIGLSDGTATDFPVYGVQLVVWPIAG